MHDACTHLGQGRNIRMLCVLRKLSEGVEQLMRRWIPDALIINPGTRAHTYTVTGGREGEKMQYVIGASSLMICGEE